jgi:hypothetical protein
MVRVAALLAFLAAALPGAASASQLIDRNASGVELEVNRAGQALLTYRADGKLKHVLAWGAVNAIPPTRSRPQVDFRLDYSGGYGKYRRDYWQTFNNVCRPYDGPALAWPITACRSTDGSYWALQAWQRGLPDYVRRPSPAQAAWELRLSHWTGELPLLVVHTDWAYHRYDHLFGTLSYGGVPEFGFRSTASGEPLDSFGRNIYVDTFDSAYGRGWKRENSFLTHTHTGAFCYGFFPHGGRLGAGRAYRATVIGPGVTPDVMWQGPAPGAYAAAADVKANEELRALDDPACKAN